MALDCAERYPDQADKVILMDAGVLDDSERAIPLYSSDLEGFVPAFTRCRHESIVRITEAYTWSLKYRG
ncbi:hypothetical protein ACPOL_1392 [Acidisarcina polymorpha]|uniref:Uncharacterized protein n=2 Tax=Acidisarcina polymorpha TaxID=2211140 RepID=A0A2Z5FVH0_9BACT|nr:hypothetical protein ACPOL_1392 [Acidisarcina polymorpha]